MANIVYDAPEPVDSDWFPNSPEFPIYPEFPKVTKHFPEFPRIYWVRSGWANIVYDAPEPLDIAGFPNLPRIPQYSSEFPRIYWFWSGKAKIVYDVREFAKLAKFVVRSNVEDTCVDMFRPVWTSLDWSKFNQNSYYCLMMSENSVDFTSKQC